MIKKIYINKTVIDGTEISENQIKNFDCKLAISMTVNFWHNECHTELSKCGKIQYANI